MMSWWFFVSVKNYVSGQVKKYKGFPVKRRYRCHCNHFLLIYKTRSVFWNSNFKPTLLGKHTSCPWNQLHFLRKSDKRLLSPKQQKKKSETRFCRRKIAKDDNVKINVSKNITCTFLLFKASVFLQIFFLRKPSFKFCIGRWMEC